MITNNQTRLNMVIGYPLSHSQSPILHNTVYRLLNCNAVLLAFANQNLNEMVKIIKSLSVELIAVTMPFKEQIVPYLDGVSVEVETLKAVNTILYRNGKLLGYNTDIDGIKYALRDLTLAHKKVLLIGAGGAARAAAYYLKKNNATLFCFNRTIKKGTELTKHFGGEVVIFEELNGLSIDIIINTTPLGLHPQVDCSPMPDYIFNSNQIVFDMVYHPLETMLLKEAKAQGALCISGLDMFIGQGLKQIELWLNKNIGTQTMINVIKKSLIEAQNENN